MAKFNYLMRIEHHCKDSSAGENIFRDAMGVLHGPPSNAVRPVFLNATPFILSKAEQLSACPLLLGATLHNPKQGEIDTERFVASVNQILASWHPGATLERMSYLEFESFKHRFLETRRKGIKNASFDLETSSSTSTTTHPSIMLMLLVISNKQIDDPEEGSNYDPAANHSKSLRLLPVIRLRFFL
jgi:hypothetical protein